MIYYHGLTRRRRRGRSIYINLSQLSKQLYTFVETAHSHKLYKFIIFDRSCNELAKKVM